MTDVEQAETQAVFNLAARVAEYVTSMEMVLLEESGKLDELGDKIAAEEITRAEYSPIFAAMNKADHQAYDEICAEIEAASQLEIMGGKFSNQQSLTAIFMQRVAAPALRMQELLVSIAVRENLMDEEDLIELWSEESGDEHAVALLHKYEAPVIAHIVSEARLQIL